MSSPLPTSPVSLARGVGSSGADDEYPFPFVPRANGSSREYENPNIVTCLLQVNERFVEPHTEEASNIFSKHPTGLQFPDDPQHFGPQIAFIVEAALPPCGGERLVIPKFRITRLIPNKIRSPKPSRESLQRKDFCIKTSG